MTTIKPLAAATALIATVMSGGSFAAEGDVEGRIAELERQIAELRTMMVNNSSSIESNSEEIETVRPTRKGTTFRYGGYVDLDFMYSDFEQGKPANSLIEDFLVSALIPVEPAGGGADDYQATNLHAKSSRIYFTTKTETENMGSIESKFELDFLLGNNGNERISNSWNSRMRHAYFKWNYAEDQSLLVGQTWSTFFNVSALPELIDFVGPVGTIFNRQPMVRWTTGKFQFAVENPATRLNQNVDGSISTRLDDSEDVPDLVARYNDSIGDLNWSVAAIGRQLSYENRDGDNAYEIDSDEEYGYGLSLSGKWMLGRDDLRFMVSYGDALGRYLGLNAFNDGYIGADGGIETIDQWGAYVAYAHYWSPRWRSTVSVSTAGADNPDTKEFDGAGSLAESYTTAHLNLNWLPAPRLSLGGELIYGKKELEDGRDGEIARLQMGLKYAW